MAKEVQSLLTWVCTKVNRDCTSFAIFARVAAMRASSWAVASVLSPCRSSSSQAVRIKACSERKPRSLAAERTRSRNSLLGNNKFRSIRCFFIGLPPLLVGGAFVAQIARKQPPPMRSEEHTFELQSRLHLVCRLLLEKKKKTQYQATGKLQPGFAYAQNKLVLLLHRDKEAKGADAAPRHDLQFQTDTSDAHTHLALSR